MSNPNGFIPIECSEKKVDLTRLNLSKIILLDLPMSEWIIKPKISFESTFFSFFYFSPLIEKFGSRNKGLPNSIKFDFSGLK